MQMILSSAPDARYRPLGENRTEWIVPRWWLMWQSCRGFEEVPSSELYIASVDQTRTWPSAQCQCRCRQCPNWQKPEKSDENIPPPAVASLEPSGETWQL